MIGTMKNLNLIELNEINFDVVKKYVDKSPGAYPGFEKLFQLNLITTSSEHVYEHIEPWIQWPSVHTCQTYAEHQIFRLGDVVSYKGEQIFEKIEKAGFTVGCVSPMNADNRLDRPAYFIPDPWTDSTTDNSRMSNALHQALRQAVNDNSSGKVKVSTYVTLFWILVTKTQKRNWINYISLFRNRKKRWNKALFLDLLLFDVFIYLKKTKKADFHCMFLNAFAHIQHHYFLNSSEYKGRLENSSDYINSDEDPIYDALKIYDKLILGLLDDFNENFIFATALRQLPVERQIVYYRLKNHKKFLNAIGVRNFTVEPRMTRDFLIKFLNIEDLEDALNKLSKIKHKNQHLFSEIERRERSLFVTLTYSNELLEDEVIVTSNQSLNLSEEFNFVAVKNGHHDATGYLFTNFETKKINKGNHVKEIGSEILNYFGA